MSSPGFASDDAGLRSRGEAVARVADALDRAAEAAAVASAPDAYGTLCAFFPALLEPAQQQAREAFGRASGACHDTVRGLHTAGSAFGDTDDAGALGFGG